MSEQPVVRFEVNPEKALEALVYVAHHYPALPWWRIMKVIFYADKRHLGRYGRPITGDAYMAMKDGPVPSLVYNLLKLDSWLPDELLDRASTALILVPHSEGQHSAVSATRLPDLELLSISDRKCLDWAIESFASMPYKKLWEISHREPAYKAAPLNGEMSVELMVDRDIPDREQFLEQLRETAGEMVL